MSNKRKLMINSNNCKIIDFITTKQDFREVISMDKIIVKIPNKAMLFNSDGNMIKVEEVTKPVTATE